MIGPVIVESIPDLSSDKQLEHVLFAISMLGIGEMIGGILMGQIVDHLSSRIGVICNVIAILFAGITSIL